MTERSKPTPGPWTIFDNPSSNYGLEIRALMKVKARKVVCRLGGPDRDANAHLIAEAGTVYHETDLTPQQLRVRMERAEKQRDELLAALKEYVRDYGDNEDSDSQLMAEKARAAIAKVEGRP